MVKRRTLIGIQVFKRWNIKTANPNHEPPGKHRGSQGQREIKADSSVRGRRRTTPEWPKTSVRLNQKPSDDPSRTVTFLPLADFEQTLQVLNLVVEEPPRGMEVVFEQLTFFRKYQSDQKLLSRSPRRDQVPEPRGDRRSWSSPPRDRKTRSLSPPSNRRKRSPRSPRSGECRHHHRSRRTLSGFGYEICL